MLRTTGRLLERNPLKFSRQRRAHLARCRPDPSRTAHTEILEALIRDGFFVETEYMTHDEAREVEREVTVFLERARNGEDIEGATTSRYPEYACYHVDGIERRVPALSRFVDDPMILSVADAYGGGGVVPLGVRAELRDDARKNELVDDLHADTWRFRFKAMLYLTDVTEDTSPFRYLAGTHRDDGWRWRRFGYDYLGHALHGNPAAERIRRAEAESRLADPAVVPKRITGPAGTLILFDTRGLHSATTLRKGRRVVLNRTFVVEEDLA